MNQNWTLQYKQKDRFRRLRSSSIPLVVLVVCVLLPTPFLRGEENVSRQIGTFLCVGSSQAVHNDQVGTAFETVFTSLTDLSERLSLPPMQAAITVRIFDDAQAWQTYFKKENFAMAYRRSLFLNNKTLVLKSSQKNPVIFIYLSPKFDQDLRHESVHAYLQSVFEKPVPLWLDEGLAEYYENATDPIYNESWFERTCARIENGQMKKIKQLEAMTDPARMQNNEYSDSWAWACFLLHGPQEIRAVLVQYAKDLSVKKLFYPTLTKLFAKARLNPDQEFTQWFQWLKQQHDNTTEHLRTPDKPRPTNAEGKPLTKAKP